jgi:exonuclease SbcC
VRPLRLELRGFTAFRERTVVEFEGRRLFTITGPTGAGKSSLLDAMTWALYGQVPRVGASTRQLLTHGETSMQVRFDFATRDATYRVVRKAPAVKGTRLERRQADGSWRHEADNARDVTREVTRLLGMDFTTFTRTVLLPQNEFDEFLTGDLSERRAILTKLLGLGVYEQARALARNRGKLAAERATTIEAQLGQLNLASPERIAELEAELATVQQRLCALGERREALRELGEVARSARDAAKAHTEARATAETAARAASEAALSVEGASAAVAGAERRCDDLSRERGALAYDPKRHQALAGQVERLKLREAAEGDLADARAKLNGARRALATARNAAESAARALAEAEAAITAMQEVEERTSARLAEAAGRAGVALAELETRAAAATAELERAKQERESLARQLPELERVGEQLSERLAAREGAAAEVKRAVAERKRAEREAATAAKQLTAVVKQLTTAQATLAEARHADLAATLRAGLKPGDACPVCGEPIDQLVMAAGTGELEAAEAAVHEAERILEEQRATSVEAQNAAAAAVAREESATANLASVDALLVAVDEELARLETSRKALPRALDQRRAALGGAEKREAAAAEVAGTLTTEREALRLALARVPDEVTPAHAREGCADLEVLAAALEAWRPARVAVGAAERQLQQARASHAKFGEEIAAAGARAEAAEERVARAEQALAAHGDAPAGTEANALREALEVAERAARRAEELDTQIAAAKAEIAGAIATRTAAEAEAARGGAAAGIAQQAVETASAAACAAEEGLTRAWREAIDGESAPDFEALRRLMNAHQDEERAAAARGGVLSAQIEQAQRETSDAERMRGEVASNRATAELSGALARELQGDRFVGYVQREAMQLLAADASYRLDKFTGGRYELASEENEFVVVDRLNGDERRSVKTLSGGETFLASLALALSLAEHLPQLAGLGGAVSLQSLFLDEGFGALDAESLDLAVQGLETLAGGQRVIGVISHMEELAERLPDRIEVVKQGNTSTVRG